MKKVSFNPFSKSNKTQSTKTDSNPAKEAGKKVRFDKDTKKDGNPRTTQKPRGSEKPSAPKAARNGQSALHPGNSSGLEKQKDHPLVQFGPILKEFLSSKELVNKEITVKYTHDLNKHEIAVSFKEVLANGVSVSTVRQMSIEEYLAKRNTLLKKKDDSSHFIGFVTKLIDRLGIDLTAAKPNVTFRSVENFVFKHLSPVERVVVNFTIDEYDRIDTRKIPEIMKPSTDVIKNHYGSFKARTEFLIKQINSDGPSADMEPPNWALNGVTGLSKGVALEALKLEQVVKVTKEQQDLIALMGKQFFDVGDDDTTTQSKSSLAARDEGVL